MDEDDWEELDENAMEECMVLATQLCTQQQHNHHDEDQHTHNHALEPAHSRRHPETSYRKAPAVVSNGSVKDSGVCSSRNGYSHHLHTNPVNGRVKKDVPSSYVSRFSDFSTKNATSSLNSSTRKPATGSGRSAYKVVNASSSSSSPSKTKSPSKPWPGNDANGGSHQSLKKAEEETEKLNERILLLQGEISLLRSEMRRKETTLEVERLDHCAAIEEAEKRGREKVAKQAVEADSKLKEKGTAIDRLQGELYFKKREVEELLQRCHQLEQQQQQPQVSQPPGPASKRPRMDENEAAFGRDSDTSIASRFYFPRHRGKACVGVQTESSQPSTAHRRRLDVASPKGQICQTRRMAALLSSITSSPSQQTLPSPSLHASPASSSCPSGWSLPSEWMNVISQTLIEKDKSAEQKLVAAAVERLQQTCATLTQKDGEESRVTCQLDNPVEWYEHQVGPVIQVMLYYQSSSELSVLEAIMPHLSPLHVKDAVVNVKLRPKLLEATERIARLMEHPTQRNKSEAVVSALRNCCSSIESGGEVESLVKVAAALTSHCQLCLSRDMCLISQLCKKVKKVCVPEVDILKALLDLTWGLVRLGSPPLGLHSSCHCSSQLLGTFLWCTYETLEASHNTGKERKVWQVVVLCVQLLHHWSSVDPSWWERVSAVPHFPALMVMVAARANQMRLDRETLELLRDLYEFEDGAFE